jgi:hypothetical protein
MSYALTLHNGRMALGVSAQASVASKLPDCKDAELTGNDYIDKTIVKCCEDVKRKWGLSFEDQVKGIIECGARGGATATCMAAGVVTYGITTVLAPLCGEVGAFVAKRVTGYSGVQLGAAITAAVACGAFTGGLLSPLCGIVAAELIGWLSDAVGPIIEGIFDPGAAKRRELAARDAYHKAIEANEKACEEADEKYRLAWGMGIGSLKELYRKAFPTAALQAKAKKVLGFGGSYDEIARAMAKSGAGTSANPFGQNKGKRGCYGDHPDWECPGCEQFDYVKSAKFADPRWKGTPWDGIASSWVVEGRKDPWSDICPFSLHRFYLTERQKALGDKPKRDQVTAWEKKFVPTIAAIASQIYPAMVQAITAVGSKITSIAVALKQQELFEAAQNATREQLATRATRAASTAEAAADAALKGSAQEGKRAIVKTRQQYDIAVAAHDRLLGTFGEKPTSSGAAASRAIACAQDRYCKMSGSAVTRAKAAMINAPLFARRASNRRLLIGAALVAGTTGAALVFTRK